jgi:hypothetical protein
MIGPAGLNCSNAVELSNALGNALPNGKELMSLTIIETSTGKRPVKAILRGLGMVRPNRRLALHENGSEEVLDPKTARLAPDHWLVRQHPEWFHPCDREDPATAQEMLRMLKRAEREELELIRGLGRAPHHHRMRLPERDHRTWRLP